MKQKAIKLRQSTRTITKEVIQGKFRNGKARRRAMQRAGYNPDAAQQEVNKLL